MNTEPKLDPETLEYCRRLAVRRMTGWTAEDDQKSQDFRDGIEKACSDLAQRYVKEDDQPAPFVPRFKVGDRVIAQNIEGKVEDWIEEIQQGMYGLRGGGWWREDQLEPAPWQLPAPPEGQSWHRTDGWKEEWLPPGFRPLLKGEPCQQGDKVRVGDVWSDGIDTGFPMASQHLHTVTQRPLPEPAQQQEKCPVCGSHEVPKNTPRTTYACGSSDYDQRTGTFIQGSECMQIREDDPRLSGSLQQQEKDVCPTCGTSFKDAIHYRDTDIHNKVISEGTCLDPWHSPSQVEAREWPSVEYVVKVFDLARHDESTRLPKAMTEAGLTAVRQLIIDHAERMLAKEREAHETQIEQAKSEGFESGKNAMAIMQNRALETVIAEKREEFKKQLAAERTARLAAEKERDELMTLAYETRPTLTSDGKGITWADEAQKSLAAFYKACDERDSLRAQLAEAEKQNAETKETLLNTVQQRNEAYIRCGYHKDEIATLKPQLGISRTFTEVTPEEFEAAQIILGRWLIEHPEISELVQRKKVHQGVTAIDYAATKQDNP